jgi:hypothetical protein
MDKIYGLDDWILDRSINDRDISTEATIYLKYPEISILKHLSPSDRKKKVGHELAERFEELVHLVLPAKYARIGTKKQPRGIQTSLPLDKLKLISGLDYIGHIYIKEISPAIKKRYGSPQGFYCIKMTVAVEIEGIEKGLQTFEERLVLIRAKSEKDAYSKIEQRVEEYGKPYLNSDGRQVRWRIESLDDCYATDVTRLSDFNNPNGVEVFSKLKSRKLTPERIWDGS